LEMQRRKSDYGVDGIRVDGAQDFKGYDPVTDTLYHDDEYLRQMNDLVQNVAGQQYRPWMIFEDGRPWPRDDWELASTYREVTKQLPNVWQWGPLTFAHNTPFLFTFWVNKSWRVREITTVGKYWITGCANHDTLRRGTQVDSEERINTRLGNSLPEVFQNAYDNPSAKLFDYCMMPGIPMDFINALMRAPWGFIRNTDDKYGVKVVSEESNVLNWLMWDERWAKPTVFPRLKKLGFTDLERARNFFAVLNHTMQATHYSVEGTAKMMNVHEPKLPGPKLDVPTLKQIALAWMEDMFDYCNVSQYAGELDPEQTAFNLSLREFRREHPWLMENLRDGEFFDRQQPANGTAFFFGWRRSPDDSEHVLFAANMEGEPVRFIPTNLPIPGLPEDGWEIVLAAKGVYSEGPQRPMTLQDSHGIVFTRRG
ncbi:MAG: glucosylglycerol hydrolase, partial [Chloroflexota bacterium]